MHMDISLPLSTQLQGIKADKYINSPLSSRPLVGMLNDSCLLLSLLKQSQFHN